jgi:hypothetical protein
MARLRVVPSPLDRHISSRLFRPPPDFAAFRTVARHCHDGTATLPRIAMLLLPA